MFLTRPPAWCDDNVVVFGVGVGKKDGIADTHWTKQAEIETEEDEIFVMEEGLVQDWGGTQERVQIGCGVAGGEDGDLDVGVERFESAGWLSDGHYLALGEGKGKRGWFDGELPGC